MWIPKLRGRSATSSKLRTCALCAALLLVSQSLSQAGSADDEPQAAGKRSIALTPGSETLVDGPLQDPVDDTGVGARHAHEHDHGDAHGEIENIVVTASPLAHQADELAIPVERLRRDEIIDQLGSTLGDTLRNVPGVATTGFSGGASRPVIRGQDAYRTEVLESGLSTQDVSRLSPDHAVPINPLTAQYVEIVRGPAVLRYGGGASAGAVNAITNRVPLTAADEAVQGEVVGIYGSNGDQADVAGVLDGGLTLGTGELAWHVDGLYSRSDDYQTGSGASQAGTAREGYSVSAGSALLFDAGRLGFAYARFDSDYAIPEDEPVSIDMRTNRYRFEGDVELPVTGLRSLKFRGVYSDYRHDERVMGIAGQRFDNDEFDGRLEMLHEPLLGFIGAAGLYARHQDLTASGEAAEFLAPSQTNSFALYLFEERPLRETLDLELGLRLEGTWVDGTPITGEARSRGFAPISGSFALLAQPLEAWSIGLTGAAGQRAPSQVELFARGPHEATATFEIGNPAFGEETSYTGELRIQGVLEAVEFEASAFATYYADYIYGQLTGVTVDESGMPDPSGELDQLFYRNRNALFYGGEVALGAELLELWGGVVRTDWQLDFVRARFTSGGGDRNIPRITPLRWGGSLAYQHQRVSGRLGFLRTEAQWHASDEEFATESFTMLELSLRYRLPVLEEALPLELSLAARNLLDEAARNPLSFNKQEVLLPGRSFQLSLHGRF